jgi:protein-S-isoprenylcysteine O-methyltransferase Ste14
MRHGYNFIAMKTKLALLLGAEMIIFGVILFGCAGTVDWPAGWIFLILFFGFAIHISLLLAERDPALLAERMKPFAQLGQPVWDRIILMFVLVLWFAWLIVTALDAGRFHWSTVPGWLQWVGGVGFIVSMGMWYPIFGSNTFLAPVVRIQKERDHKVISTGPFGVLRHPLYASTLLLIPASTFLLGSLWGLIPGFLILVCIIVRTAMEDQKLQRDLDGYIDYTKKVRYRLIPFIW